MSRSRHNPGPASAPPAATPPSSKPPLAWPALDDWLASRQGLILAVLLGASTLLRLACFTELADGPCLALHRYGQSDMNFFDLWARRIAAGDWLTDAALHPLHGWHQRAADDYFAAHPDRLAEFTARQAPDGRTLSPAEALWNHWYGEKRFHQEPLYPWLIAATYRMLGQDVRWVFAWQMLLGVLTNVLVYLVTRRHFGRVAALVAGLLALLHAPFVFYDLVLLRTSLEVFATVALVWLADRAIAAGRIREWAGLGFAAGLAILLKMTFLLFTLAALGMVLLVPARTPRRRVVLAACCAGGLLLAMAPAVIRNVAVGAPSFSLSSVGPVTFVGANLVDSPVSRGFHAGLTHLAAIMGDADGKFLPVVFATLRTHDGFGSVVALLAAKFAWIWHAYEIPNNANFYLFRDHAIVLRMLPAGFGLIGPAAVVGILLAVRNWRAHRTLFAGMLAAFVPLLVFYVLSRFRAPLVALLLPCAALAIERVAAAVRLRDWRSACLLAAGFLGLGLWSWQPLERGRTLVQRSDFEGLYDAWYGPRHQAAEQRGDLAAAAGELATLRQSMPALLDHLGPDHPAAGRDEAALAAFQAALLEGEAAYRAALGESTAAEGLIRRAAELNAATAGW